MTDPATVDRYFEYRLYDTDQLLRGYPRQTQIIGVILNVPTIPLLRAAGYRTRITEAIERILEPDERTRLVRGVTIAVPANCCYLCGGALGSHQCNGCKRRYNDDSVRYLSGISLPPIVRERLIAAGHVFER